MRAIFSSDSDVLVGLDAQAPLRVLQAILDGAARILLKVCAIHRLQKESLERQVCESFRRGVVLWKDELELVAFDDREFAIRFRADADPVDSGRRHDCPVGLHGDLEATPMEGLDQGGVHLQQGLSARQYAEAMAFAARPLAFDRVGQIVRALVPPSAAPVSADKVRVAELARGGGAIRLAPGPEIAASEAAEHRAPAGLRALPLQGEEDLLHRKTAHAVLPIVRR